jgi:phosphatidylglycerophosphatase C
VSGRDAALGTPRLLAIFDLDGTVSVHDTLTRYLLGHLRRHPGRGSRWPRALPSLAAFAAGRIEQGQLKSAWIRAALGGLTREEVAGWTTEFVPQVVAYGLHADALRAIHAHQEAGDALVLLSASPDLYVPAIGRALGFNESVCTEIAWHDDRLDGALASPNRRGAEKARCLTELRQRYGFPVVAYANAASDLGHLALADRAVLVNGARTTRSAAAKLGIACVTWR